MLRLMFWMRLCALASALALSACGGCDDATGTTSEPDSGAAEETGLPPSCTDSDGDGFPVGLTCFERIDCDDGNDAVNPGASEQCFDGLDNDCDGGVDEGCPNCVDGATEACGTDEGACQAGERTCTNGEWTACEGAIEPALEICNGRDDDCDGEVDENAESLCDDGDPCNGTETCSDGFCSPGNDVDCSMFDGPCTIGECAQKDGGCRAVAREDGLACDDGNFCTIGGTCSAGECLGTPRDCGAEGDVCNTGVCDETANACVKQPVSDGTSCDDGAFCTTGDTCTAGVCDGAARNCSASSDQCNTGVCDEAADACVGQPRADGTSCNDGLFCNVGEACQAGVCTGGAPLDCMAPASCRTGVCDEALDMCTGPPLADGTACTDGEFCTINDGCLAGVCVGGGPRDCSASADQCNFGACDEALNLCAPSPRPDGTSCDDQLFCTAVDTCTAGACGGTQRDCSAAGDECNNGICDEASTSCRAQPKSDGTACFDGLFCTINDICQAGVCARQARDCSGEDDVCNLGACDDAIDACVKDPRPNGTACNDNLFCTISDACQAGACTGAQRDCSGAGDQCTIGVCDESQNSCTGTPRPNGTSCDDGRFCTLQDICNSGVCSGAARDCSGVGDQCNSGNCNDTTDTCVATPRPNGTVCNDGAWCTTSDSCSSGTCGGTPRDCSGVGDQCNSGTCDEVANACQKLPLDAGTACSDGQFCTENDSCLAGQCLGGTNRDCSAASGGDMCLDGVCDEGANQCIAIDNGTCDPCQNGTPTADAGPDQVVTPNTVVQLDGTGSSDPTNDLLTYTWRIDTRPSGSTAALSNANVATPTLLGDVSGDFVVCLAVQDSNGCAAPEDCTTITVEPLVDLHIELVWFSDKSDIDLHYRAPNGTYWNRDKVNCGAAQNGTDVHFCVKNPDWGLNNEGLPDGDRTNDPSLDVDNIAGFGPENINQSNLFDGTYQISLHYYAEKGALRDGDDPLDARVRVYVSGNLVFERTRSMACQDWWTVADVVVSGNGTNVSVQAINGQNTQETGFSSWCLGP